MDVSEFSSRDTPFHSVFKNTKCSSEDLHQRRFVVSPDPTTEEFLHSTKQNALHSLKTGLQSIMYRILKLKSSLRRVQK